MKIKASLIKVLKAISRIVPKDKKLWIFGSRFGEHYDENSRKFFEFVNQAALDIRAVWLTKDTQVYEHLKKKGYEVYKTFSLYGYLYSMRAGVVIVSISLLDVNYRVVAGSKIIQLWHGTPLRDTDLAPLCEDYSMVIIAAEEFLHKQKMSEIRQFRYALTGYPRNDILFSSEKIEQIERLRSLYQCKKLVLYLPTHRQRLSSDGKIAPIPEFNFFDSFGFDIDYIEDLMKNNRSLFALKLHSLQRFPKGAMLERVQKSKFIHLIDAHHPLVDVHDYLRYTDILITDYSSVYFDFLLLDRPIIFAPFDYDEQLMVRSIRFPYEEVTPGPKAKDWPEVYSWLKDIFAGKDDWTESRQGMNRRFNAYRDGRNSERVYREIKSLLNTEKD